MAGNGREENGKVDKNGWRLIQKENLESKENGFKACSKYPRKLSRRQNNILVKSTVPYKREEVMKWYGWGYPDSEFYFKDGNARFSGDRYPICNMNLPYFKEYLKEKYQILLDEDKYPEKMKLPNENEYPKSLITDKQLAMLKQLDLKISTVGSDRFVRCHGQQFSEMYHLKNNKITRIPDAVIWPECHEDVVQIVRICNEQNIVIIPYGGGTSVSGSVTCPANEPRPILSMDTCMMNEILWVDEESQLACCEAGIIGQDLERELQKIGYTCGHEPDSMEFSTLGGWVATRASGMKKNQYGNIEDIVVHARMVSPRGVLEKGTAVPRMSSGPDFDHVILGSEGCFGVITEVIIKIKPLPAVRRYGSLIFPNFESGFQFTRDVARQRLQPASLRLMDNDQFLFGRTFRPESTYWTVILDGMKDIFLTKIKGYDWNKMCMVTLVYEGEMDQVMSHEKKINSIAYLYGGIPAGETVGKTGYAMTFVIAYIRDVAIDLNIFTETLETSISWDKALQLNEAVKRRIALETAKFGIRNHSAMVRVAQAYDSGCCLYLYYAIGAENLKNPIEVSEHIEAATREEIVAGGGSISHHHGVGKSRRRWYERSVSTLGLNLFRSCKEFLDPNNIFANANFTENLSVDT